MISVYLLLDLFPLVKTYKRQIILWVRIYLQCDSLLLSHFLLIADK